MAKKNIIHGQHGSALESKRRSGLRRRQKQEQQHNALRDAKERQEQARKDAFTKRARTEEQAYNQAMRRHELQHQSRAANYQTPMTSEERQLLDYNHGNDPIIDALNRVDSRREALIKKYIKDSEGNTSWDKMNSQNRQNIKRRLDQAKKLQFQAHTGIAVDPDHLTSPEVLAERQWATKNHEKNLQESDEMIRQLRRRAIEKKELEHLEKLQQFSQAVEDPKTLADLQKSIAIQKTRQKEKYEKERGNRRREQDEFIKRFEHKQKLRQKLLEGNFNDDEIEEFIQEDDAFYDLYKQDRDYYESIGIDIDTVGIDGDVDPALVEMKQLKLTQERARAAAENQNQNQLAVIDQDKQDTDNNVDNNTKDIKSLSHLTRTIESRKKYIPKEKISAVFNRVYDALDKYNPSEIAKESGTSLLDSERNTIAREVRLSKLRKELGILPLDQKDSEELQDEALKRLSTGIVGRKQSLAAQLDKLQSEHDRDQVLLDDAKRRKKKGQVYAPVVLKPPTDLELYKVVEDARDEVDTDELSVLQRHLGIKRSPQTLLKKRLTNARLNRNYRVLQHFRGRFVQKTGTDLVDHPYYLGRKIERNELGLHHRRKLEVEAEANPYDPSDTRSDEERDYEERANIRSVDEIPRPVRHELQTSQIFGPNILNMADPMHAQVMAGFRKTFLTALEERVLVPTEKRHYDPDKDPSNWRKATEFEVAHVKPRLGFHVDPKTGRRGFHLLHYTNQVVLPTVSKEMPDSLELPDGMKLEINKKKLFETPYDYRLDRTRLNPFLETHLRPEWEQEPGFTDDEKEDEILKLEATNNEVEFERAYGKEPEKYYSKVYHDVLGKSLVQKSRQFMHNVQSLTYQRPLDRLLSEAAQRIPGLNLKGQPVEINPVKQVNSGDFFDRQLMAKRKSPIASQYHPHDDERDEKRDLDEMIGPYKVKNRVGDQVPQSSITPGVKNQISRSFSEFLPQLLKDKYSQHEYHSHQLNDLQERQLQNNVNWYTNNLQFIIQSKVFTPVQQKVDQFIRLNKTFGGSSKADYDLLRSSLELNGRDVPKMTGLAGAFSRATNYFRSMYERDGSGLDLPVNQPLANQTQVSSHTIPPSLQRYTSPIQHLKTARREHTSLDLSQQQQQQQQSQRSHHFQPDSTLHKIQSKLDSLSTPEIQEKAQNKSWLEQKLLSAPLQTHITSYLSASLPALAQAFRTTTAVQSQRLRNNQQDKINNNLPSSPSAAASKFLSEHQHLNPNPHPNQFNVQTGLYPSQIPQPSSAPLHISPFQRSLQSHPSLNSPTQSFTATDFSDLSPRTASMLGIPQSRHDITQLINNTKSPHQPTNAQPGTTFNDFLKSPMFDTTPKYVRSTSDLVAAVAPYLPSKFATLFMSNPQRAADHRFEQYMHSLHSTNNPRNDPHQDMTHNGLYNTVNPHEYAQQLSLIEAEKKSKQRNALRDRDLPKFDAPDSFLGQQRGGRKASADREPRSVFDAPPKPSFL